MTVTALPYAEVSTALEARDSKGPSTIGDDAALIQVVFHPTQDVISSTDGTTHALSCGSKSGQATVAIATREGCRYGVRRLTPRECERLQGLPDDYTLVPFHGKPAPDSRRYRAIGNSMAVPVMKWIGKRIALVESLV